MPSLHHDLIPRPRRAPAFLLAAGIVAGLATDAAAQPSGPTLRVRVNDLPELVFTPGSPAVRLSLPSGRPVSIDVAASANPPAESITEIGYASGPEDEDWNDIPSWCETCRSQPVRIFQPGTYRLFVGARDDREQTTLAELVLVVVPVAVEATSWTDLKRGLAH